LDRIDQDIFNREGRETSRRWEEKMKFLKVENWETKIRIGQDFFYHGWGQDGISMDLKHRSSIFNPDWIREIRG